ncbi:hypothetical protein [uncultured Aeromicrobium sp.]|nr:hypothetical protein [uncultured Aeromicrobium sp.]
MFWVLLLIGLAGVRVLVALRGGALVLLAWILLRQRPRVDAVA